MHFWGATAPIRRVETRCLVSPKMPLLAGSLGDKLEPPRGVDTPRGGCYKQGPGDQ